MIMQVVYVIIITSALCLGTEENQQVYEFSVDNLPADTYDNDLAKMCKGQIDNSFLFKV